MKNVVTLVLGGGRGTRLYPLTKLRSKPAVPVAGKYRLIDIPLSNCINSDLTRIYVLTQFNSVSLHRHIRSTYGFDRFHGGFVEILAAQQTIDSPDWYQGTADAVRQNLRYFQQPGIDYVLILSGDQLYRMNFKQMIRTHKRANADVTIASVPVADEDASGLGIMRLDDTGRVVGFLEKPTTKEELDHVRVDPNWLKSQGVSSLDKSCLASMGIYLFNRDTLVEVLEKTDYEDFGKEIFPASIRSKHVHVHLFDRYWEDIGTIKSFFEANINLAMSNPPFALESADSPIYSRARFLPPSRIDGASIKSSLLADGCLIGEGTHIENSVIGLRCMIGESSVIKNSILLGNDFYQAPDDLAGDKSNGRPPLGIGSGCYIENAIIDKNCHIGNNVKIINEEGLQSSEEMAFGMIRDGITVLNKDCVLHDNQII